MLITIFAFAAIVFCRFYTSSLKTSAIISILSFCTKHMSYLKVSLLVRLVGCPVNLGSNRLTPSRRTLLVKMLVDREVKSSPCTLSLGTYPVTQYVSIPLVNGYAHGNSKVLFKERKFYNQLPCNTECSNLFIVN